MTQRRASLQWLTFAGLALFLSIAVLYAVHDFDLFELGDGLGSPGSADILGSDAQPGCDWADLFDADPTPDEFAAAADACGGLDAVFVQDELSQGSDKDDTSFVQGASKNDEPIANWRWDTGNSPSKDDISSFFAFAVLNDLDELILYAGVERLDASGDSHVDFEFNQSLVALDKDPACGSDGSDGSDDRAPCEFVGEKVDNDLLVVMDFEKGGNLGFLEIRQWNGTDYALVESISGEGCNGANTVCAVNNGFPIDAGPWPSFDGSGSPTSTIGPNGFTEAAINVSRLLGRSPCFSTLQAKTRSSSSFNSSLQDFALANFAVCSVDVEKSAAGPTGEPLSKIGDLVTFSFSVANDGGGTLRLQSMTDSLLGDITTEAETSGCQVLSINDRCEFDIVQAIPDESSDPINSTVSVVYISEVDVGTGTSSTASLVEQRLTGPIITSVDDSDSVEINLFQPSVAVDKTGDAVSTPGQAVDYSVTVTNTGSADSPALANGVVVDSLLGDLLDPANPFVTSSTCGETLAPGSSCVILASRVVLETDPDPLPNSVSVTYNPAGGFPNVISDFDDHEVDLVYPGCDIEISALPVTGRPGDVVTYGYTFSNTGDVIIDTISVEDTLLGALTSSFPASLDPGQSFSTQFTRTIEPDDPTPLTNTSTAVCGVRGLPDTTVTDTATVNIDVVRPSITVSKTGDLLSTAGNTVSYAISVANTSSANTPDLVNGTLTDTLLGDLLDPANPFVVSSTCSTMLAGGASCTVQAQRVVQDTDPDPLPNTASASYNPDGLSFAVTGSDGHSVDLVSPGLGLSLDVTPLQATPGTVVTWTYVITNTGDVALDRITVNDTVLGDISAAFPAALEPGQSVTVTLTRTVEADDPDPLASSSVATYQVRDLPNVITGTATASIDIFIPCALSPGFWKGGEGVPKWDAPGDPVALAAGFFTASPYPYLDGSLAGSGYLDVLNTSRSGDVTLQLAFKAIAARLNQAAFGVPAATSVLLDQIDAYLAAHPVGSNPGGQARDAGQDLLEALNDYFAAVGEGSCPPSSAF